MGKTFDPTKYNMVFCPLPILIDTSSSIRIHLESDFWFHGQVKTSNNARINLVCLRTDQFTPANPLAWTGLTILAEF